MASEWSSMAAILVYRDSHIRGLFILCFKLLCCLLSCCRDLVRKHGISIFCPAEDKSVGPVVTPGILWLCALDAE